ncbi:MAG: hypothetical protein IPH52_28475 [Leptospiraceae bacterium]|nr:hypothetical protein [Leptospiraceae bacterium]MBK7058919.1 hypothetical protein [Leptospiraceae bacterium]
MTTYQLIMTILALTFSIAGLIITGLRIIKNGVVKELKEENESHFKSLEKSIDNLGMEVKKIRELKEIHQ